MTGPLILLMRASLFLAGLALVAATLVSAVRTFVLPRGAPDPLARTVFGVLRRLFQLRLRFARGYEARDRIMAYYAPVSLLLLLPTWYFVAMVGYAMMYWAVGFGGLYRSVRGSISSITTLGFEPSEGYPVMLLMFSEASLGLLLVALLISYLPTIYAAFARREATVTLLAVRAGQPPSAPEMLKRYHRIHGLDRLPEVWEQWEGWFADVEESHTSLAPLVFFRSPQPGHSWVTAAGAVLDAASLSLSTLDAPDDPDAALCIRAGFLALRRIAGYFEIDFPTDPSPGDPISVRQDEFDAVYEDLKASGLPVRADRQQAWRDFAGWRVNYDRPLLALAELTMAPAAPWYGNQALLEAEREAGPPPA